MPGAMCSVAGAVVQAYPPSRAHPVRRGGQPGLFWHSSPPPRFQVQFNQEAINRPKETHATLRPSSRIPRANTLPPRISLQIFSPQGKESHTRLAPIWFPIAEGHFWDVGASPPKVKISIQNNPLIETYSGSDSFPNINASYCRPCSIVALLPVVSGGGEA